MLDVVGGAVVTSDQMTVTGPGDRGRGRGETEPRMSRHWPALSPLLTSERSGETPHVTDTGGMNYE